MEANIEGGTPARVDEVVSVVVVPPDGIPGSEAEARQAALIEASRDDRAALADLAAEQPWLSPLRPFACGHYLATQGLHELTGGPELEIVNVPAAFVPAAAGLLNTVARYVLAGRQAVRAGQVINLGEAGVIYLAEAGSAEESDTLVLRVVFLS